MSVSGATSAVPTRPRILVVTDYYMPGYRGGGPIRTISNLVDHLGDVFDFWIVTTDRDLGDANPYPGIEPNIWHERGGSRVLYMSADHCGLWAWTRLLRDTPYDVLYLNSLFSRATIGLLALRRMGAIPRRPTILAPRGELSPSAANFKRYRKRWFMRAATRLQLFRALVWQASTPLERKDIVATLSRYGLLDASEPADVLIGTDLPPRAAGLLPGRQVKVPGHANVVFVARIARIKNLHFALQLLGNVRGRVTFDIYGPIEDARYWSACASSMKTLPPGITARYCGEVSPTETLHLFTRYDLLFLPTLSENFGYVILEALTAGCPALISNNTPWKNLSEQMAGWDIPLDMPEAFVSKLQQLISMDDAEHGTWRDGARGVAQSVINDTAAVDANRLLFTRTIDNQS